MGRTTSFDSKDGLKKGSWTPEEDEKLKACIQRHGCESWKSVSLRAGLLRCGKSCRLRWANYLRPGIRRGNFSFQEEQTVVRLHSLLGNKWSVIATYLNQRTDNEVKNHWNTRLRKRLLKMGIDPSTHKPIGTAISGQRECSHKAEWESARLQAEARLRTGCYKLDLCLESQLYATTTTFPFDHHKASRLSTPVLPDQVQTIETKHCFPSGKQVSDGVIGLNSVNPYQEIGTSTIAPPHYKISNIGPKNDPYSLDQTEDYWRNILDSINSLGDQSKN